MGTVSLKSSHRARGVKPAYVILHCISIIIDTLYLDAKTLPPKETYQTFSLPIDEDKKTAEYRELAVDQLAVELSGLVRAQVSLIWLYFYGQTIACCHSNPFQLDMSLLQQIRSRGTSHSLAFVAPRFHESSSTRRTSRCITFCTARRRRLGHNSSVPTGN